MKKWLDDLWFVIVDSIFKGIGCYKPKPRLWTHEEIEKYKADYYAPKIKEYNEKFMRMCMWCPNLFPKSDESNLCPKCREIK